jgi:hypothetical protein
MGYTGEARLQKGALACTEMKEFLMLYIIAQIGKADDLLKAMEETPTCSFTATPRIVRVILATEQVATVEQSGTEFKVLRGNLSVGR